MSIEVHVSSRTLAVRFNGVFSPTERGHLAQELVRISTLLKKNADPKVNFSMNDVEECKRRREELCNALGLSLDERKREQSIGGFKGYLERVGLPYFKIK